MNKVTCPVCKAQTSGKFCGSCGAKLDTTTAQNQTGGAFEFNTGSNMQQQVTQNQLANEGTNTQANNQANIMNNMNVSNQNQNVGEIKFTSGEQFNNVSSNIGSKINKITENVNSQANVGEIKFTSGNFGNNPNNNVNNTFQNNPNNYNNNTFQNNANNYGNNTFQNNANNNYANNAYQNYGNNNYGNNTFQNNPKNQGFNNTPMNPNAKPKININKSNFKKVPFIVSAIGSVLMLISLFLPYVSLKSTYIGIGATASLMDGGSAGKYMLLIIATVVCEVLYLSVPTMALGAISVLSSLYGMLNAGFTIGIGNMYSDVAKLTLEIGAYLFLISSIVVLVGGFLMYRENKDTVTVNLSNIKQKFTNTLNERAATFGNDIDNMKMNNNNNQPNQNNFGANNQIPNGNYGNYGMNNNNQQINNGVNLDKNNRN